MRDPLADQSGSFWRVERLPTATAAGTHIFFWSFKNQNGISSSSVVGGLASGGHALCKKFTKLTVYLLNPAGFVRTAQARRAILWAAQFALQ